MCLAAFAVDACEAFPLVVAANRDESHSRPTAAAKWWAQHADVLGGQDLEAGGSWLAVDRRGRLAAVTNRPAPRGDSFAGSRGRLVSDYLDSGHSPEAFCTARAAEPVRYGPYNLLLFDGRGLFHSTNRSPAKRLPRGIHVLSNAPLGTPWPKVQFAASRLESLLRSAPEQAELIRQLFDLLANREPQGIGTDGAVPHRRTNTVFVRDDRYGTRSSTVALVSGNGEVFFAERRFCVDGRCDGESTYRFNAVPADEVQASR